MVSLAGNELDMRRGKVEKLRAAGWRVGTAGEFLDLSPEEIALIEIKFRLAREVRVRRRRKRLTQADLAELLGSSQSRIAKMEAADESVSLDLLLRSLLSLGCSPGDLARVIRTRQSEEAA